MSKRGALSLVTLAQGLGSLSILATAPLSPFLLEGLSLSTRPVAASATPARFSDVGPFLRRPAVVVVFVCGLALVAEIGGARASGLLTGLAVLAAVASAVAVTLPRLQPLVQRDPVTQRPPSFSEEALPAPTVVLPSPAPIALHALKGTGQALRARLAPRGSTRRCPSGAVP